MSLLVAVLEGEGELEIVPWVLVDVGLAVLDGVCVAEAVFEGVFEGDEVGVPVPEGVEVGLGVHGTAAMPRHCEPDSTVATGTPLLLYVPVAGLNEYTAVAVAA